jgi:RNA polymerase sigma-70 factor (ECF subfamily)
VRREEPVLEVSTDADVIAACDEDPERFRELFDRHFGAMVAYLRRRIGPDIAEELAVEAFAVAFRRRVTYNGERANARPWLFGIATNLLRHHRRAEQRMLRAYARTAVDPEHQLDAGYEAVEARIDAHAAAPRIALALAGLPSDERDVLLLHTWANLSYAEMADALEIPIGTVRSRLSRGRSRFRELMPADGQSRFEKLDEGWEAR